MKKKLFVSDNIDEDNDLKKRISSKLNLPKEIILGLPLISMIGKEEIDIENYKGIIEYSEELVRLSTSCGILRIKGKNLYLKQVTTENIFITGIIISVEFLV